MQICVCMQLLEDPLPSRYNPWTIEWSDEEDTIDPLPPAALNTTFIVAADTEEAMELEVAPSLSVYQNLLAHDTSS